ncbi:MAG TPA: type II secretion system protein [Candidatus Saccharimonadales bacterium]|jgi:prepilin-type N-terminal cleavage/methylation domain-containing protein|nr:type II secretion system protein [Candidatus Saccharimonadales bacterium]
MRANEDGFTLIEMLLSVGIIALLAGLSLPIYFSSQTRNDTASTTETIADGLRRAEIDARAVHGDVQWGVNFQSTSATLFQGTSYATRATMYDEPLTIPSDITIGYSGDIVFAKLTGLPTTTPSITITSKNNETATITINTKGMVDY